MISVCFQGKPFNIRVIQVYALTSKAEVEWFYENLQDLTELTPKKDVLFITEAQNRENNSPHTKGSQGKNTEVVCYSLLQKFHGVLQARTIKKAEH